MMLNVVRLGMKSKEEKEKERKKEKANCRHIICHIVTRTFHKGFNHRVELDNTKKTCFPPT